MDGPAIEGDATPLNRDIPNIIANPNYSNVLNTDCISCHSESTRRIKLDLSGNTNYVYTVDSIVDTTLLPRDIYNVRNFGWFGEVTKGTRPIISMRTANETANALEYIQQNYR